MYTAVCASAFEELESAITFLGRGRDDLNSLQRELADRFMTTCATFARDMLVADGDQDAIRDVLGLSPAPATPIRP